MLYTSQSANSKKVYDKSQKQFVLRSKSAPSNINMNALTTSELVAKPFTYKIVLYITVDVL